MKFKTIACKLLCLAASAAWTFAVPNNAVAAVWLAAFFVITALEGK